MDVRMEWLGERRGWPGGDWARIPSARSWRAANPAEAAGRVFPDQRRSARRLGKPIRTSQGSNRMLIQTTRFGQVEVDGGRIITFRDGLLGFPDQKRFALIQTGEDPVFFWLQSVDDAALAFVVCDPLAFVPDYRAPVRKDDVEALQLQDLQDCQVLVIVNKVDGYLTANLLGPLVVGAHSLLGKQLVLGDRKYSTRHRLMPVEQVEKLAKTA
jgi:flagellar assembly factor FliW